MQYPAPPALTLVEAMVATSTTPLLLLDGALDVVAVSASLCAAFGLDASAVARRPVFAMGDGEWDLPRLRSLLGVVVDGGADIAAYELDIETPAGRRCLVLNAHKLAYDDPGNVRVLLSVVDITDRRAAERETEQLLADKLLLTRELQHRVANSLQIIASVLMQSASRVGSDESREHLHQAHSRVLSVAEVQRQLSTTGEGSVALRPYFTQLCASIAASMIPDPTKLSIFVEVDDTSVSSDTSVSLGLIVTELVINSLKHAFPDGRGGRIRVAYDCLEQPPGASGEGAWRLVVGDDGVGMAAGANARAGLGTSIVEALVRQRRARLVVSGGHPGTTVTIRHPAAYANGAEVLPMIRAV